jgi:hypothetical protein
MSHPETRSRYRKVGQAEIPPENFKLPFNGQLSQDNPWSWIAIASLVPWEELEGE